MVEIIGTIKARGELLTPTDYVNLTVQFNDISGNLIDPDIFPTISIIQPSGLIAFPPTSIGVTKVAIGQYLYAYQIPINGPMGIWNDVWQATIQGARLSSTFSFVASFTDQPGISIDGYRSLGDVTPLDYSQTSIFNINKILRMVKARLNSSGKAKSVDINGNVQYVDCDIYSVDMLVTFIAMSLSKFNSTPFFTNFTFEDTQFFATFGEVIAEGAVLFSLASQALIERGREFSITDQGVNFNPATVSEMLSTQYSTTLTHFWDQLKFIKASMRSSPLGLGIFGMTSSINPAIKRLRSLRERQII